ncbi:MAG: 50S ribosomal protein L30 [Flavobacteriales bacterium Tduv]
MSKEKKVRLIQIKSAIESSKVQKLTLSALGFRKVNQQIEHKASSQILGMIRKVAHLLKVEEILGDEVK